MPEMFGRGPGGEQTLQQFSGQRSQRRSLVELQDVGQRIEPNAAPFRQTEKTSHVPSASFLSLRIVQSWTGALSISDTLPVERRSTQVYGALLQHRPLLFQSWRAGRGPWIMSCERAFGTAVARKLVAVWRLITYPHLLS